MPSKFTSIPLLDNFQFEFALFNFKFVMNSTTNNRLIIIHHDLEIELFYYITKTDVTQKDDLQNHRTRHHNWDYFLTKFIKGIQSKPWKSGGNPFYYWEDILKRLYKTLLFVNPTFKCNITEIVWDVNASASFP